MIAHKAVHVLALTRKAVFGIGHHRLGCFKAPVLFEQPAEALGLNTGDDTRLAVGVDLGGGIVAAAVYQIKAVHAARCLVGVGAVHHKERIDAVGGAARPRFEHQLADRQGGGVPVHLTTPRAVEGGDCGAAKRHIELHAHQPLHLHLVALVEQNGAARDDVAGGIDRVVQLHHQRAVAQLDYQMLGLAVLGVGAGQGLQRLLLIAEGRFFIEEVHTAAAVGIDQRHKRLANVAVTGAGHLQTHILQHHLGKLFVVADAVAQLKFVAFADVRAVLRLVDADLAAVIQMLQMSGRRDREQIGGVVGIEYKNGICSL